MKHVVVELQDKQPIDTQLNQVKALWDSDVYQSLLIHIFCGLADGSAAVSAARQVSDYLPGALVIGTMSAGEIKNGALMPQGILVSALFTETSSINLFRFDCVGGREKEVGEQLREQLDGIDHLKAIELVFPGTKMNARILYEQLSSCKDDVEIFGGYSGGHVLNSPQHFLFDSESLQPDSIFIAAYAGRDLYINVNKVIGWDALGLPFTVTKSEGNRLIELDGRPASEAYERFLQIDRTQIDNAMAGYEFPFISVHDGDERLRSTIHIDEDGSLILHGQSLEEPQIYLSYGNPSKIVEQLNGRLEELRAFQPQAILLFSCIVRKQFWQDIVNIEMSPFQKLADTAGFHTWGELLRNAHTGEVVEHNVTLLSVGFREGDLSQEEWDQVRVEDDVLRGQASLLSRLASLVNTTMRELQTAHNDLLALNRRLTTMAERDALTGLYNRGKTEQLIHRMLDERKNTGKPVSLIMVDIDHFKKVNDTYGHEIGDAVLKEVASLLEEESKKHDGAFAGRWGGEEFFLVLPRAGRNEAYGSAEALRLCCAHHPFADLGRLTISLGVITAEGTVDRKALFSRVDDALYQAKHSGRNSVVQAQD